MRAPDGPTATRYDVYFGVVAETPFGVISVAPAFGNAGERKLVFTIGRLF
jgi:NTE family protein